MANISQYINAIQNAVYGEEVRSSIINALNKVNDDNESYQAIKNEIIHSKDEVEAVMNVFDSKVNDAKELTKKIQELSNNADSSKVALDEAIKKAEGLELLIDVDNANKVKAELDNAVAKATTTKNDLESAESNVQSTITQATTIKNDLDAVITTATSIKNELNNAVSSGNELKTALTTIVNNATTVKNELNNLFNNVNTVKNELNTLITNGNKLKTDLQSEVNKSTTALNDLKKENASAVKNLADLQQGNFNPTKIQNDIRTVKRKVENMEMESGLIGNGVKILGVQVDCENKKVTRLLDAKGLTAGSDFDQFKMYGGRFRCNLRDDGMISASYGDPEYKEDGSNGQVMVYQPKFYYKVIPIMTTERQENNSENSLIVNYYISEKKLAGFKIHPAFTNDQLEELDGIYIGAYEGSLYDVSENKYLMNDEQVGDFTATTGDKLCSIAGVQPMKANLQHVTEVEAETIANNRAKGWHIQDVKVLAMQQLLMMIEYATVDLSQSGENYMGNGVNHVDAPIATGMTSELGNKSSVGKNKYYPDKSISYRGVENPFGNLWELINGYKFENDGEIIFLREKYNNDYSHLVKCGFNLPHSFDSFYYLGFSEDVDWFLHGSVCKGGYYRPLFNPQDYYNNLYNGTNNRFIIYGGYYNSYGSEGMFAYRHVEKTKIDIDINHNNYHYGCRLIYVDYVR